MDGVLRCRRPDELDDGTYISPEFRYVYAMVPKTASSLLRSSLNEALAARLGAHPGDAWTRGTSPHVTPSQVGDPAFLAMLADPEWKRVAFVRDPFARMVSIYLHIRAWHHESNWHWLAGEAGFEMGDVPSFARWVEAIAALPDEASDWHWRSQVTSLPVAVPDMTFLGRYERLAADYWALGRHLFGPEGFGDPAGGIPGDWHPPRSGSEDRLYDFYTPRLADLVARRYERDFAELGYRPGLPGLAAQTPVPASPGRPEHADPGAAPTVVTSLVDLGREHWNVHARPLAADLEWFSSLSRLANPMVVFASPGLADTVREIRAAAGHGDRTVVVETEPVPGSALDLSDAIAAALQRPELADYVDDPAHPRRWHQHVVLRSLLKPSLVAQAAAAGLAGPGLVAWIDADAVRDPALLPAGGAWRPDLDPRRMHLFAERDPQDGRPVFDIALSGDRYLDTRVIAGGPEAWAELAQLVASAVESMLAFGLVDDDRIALLMAARQAPELIDVHLVEDPAAIVSGREAAARTQGLAAVSTR